MAVMRLLIAVVAAVVAIPPSLRGLDVDHVPMRKKDVVLTLDAGGDADGAWRMLRTLQRKHVVATFFLTGRWVNKYRLLAKFIGRRYPVANHTYHHLPMTRLSDSAVAREIATAARAIRRRTGKDPRPLFRFPYGASDSRVIGIANRLGYVSVRWTVDTLGWMGAAHQSVSGAIGRVVDSLRPGEIILMHVGSAGDVDRSTIDSHALAGVIDAVRRHGYRFTTFPASWRHAGRP
jgi:peptidoglycan/xylan/chitin deacetylase (PgdA/CDA1 family)